MCLFVFFVAPSGLEFDHVRGIGSGNSREIREMKWNDLNQLCDVVRETSFAIHMYHRNGHLERIYEI